MGATAIIGGAAGAFAPWSRNDSGERTSSAAGSREQNTAAPAAGNCDRYQVTAETLALRQPDGQQIGEYFVRATKLTVQQRQGPSGNRYWLVADDEGRSGWVLPAPTSWRKLCRT